jgi:hypothetical protein
VSLITTAVTVLPADADFLRGEAVGFGDTIKGTVYVIGVKVEVKSSVCSQISISDSECLKMTRKN